MITPRHRDIARALADAAAEAELSNLTASFNLDYPGYRQKTNMSWSKAPGQNERGIIGMNIEGQEHTGEFFER